MNDLNAFDVLMPIYIGDDPEVAKAAIESVLDNTVQPKRFVIVKDGPIKEPLDRYLDTLENKYTHIHICGTEFNCGLGLALNRGLTHCKSDWVFRCDADDINDPRRFELQIEEISKNPCDVLGTQITEVDPISGVHKTKRVPIDPYIIKKFSVFRNPINHMSVLFRKSAVVSVGGYPNIKFKEDYALWLILMKAGYILKNSEKNLVNARAGDSMVSRRRGILSLKSELDLLLFRVKKCNDRRISILFSFFLRSMILLMPTGLLKQVYMVMRK